MKTLLVWLSLVVFALAIGCTTAEARDEPYHGLDVHPCTNNPLLRSSGLFGRTQPEIFLSGPDLRQEAPPAADGATRVLNVTKVDYLEDPGAEPVIDKCSSSLQSVGEDEVEISVRWHDRNCPDTFDEEDLVDCRSRASFRFSRRDLGVQELGDRLEDSDVQGSLIVEAYFTQQIRPPERHVATNMPLPERSVVHLVVRVMRPPPTPESGATPPVGTIPGRSS